MVKMSKNDNFFLTFFNFGKKYRLSQFCIKLHPYKHCDIYAVMNKTRQAKLSITKGVPEVKITSCIVLVNLIPPYKNAMFRFTARRF